MHCIYGLLSVIGSLILIGAAIGLTAYVASSLYKYLSGSNSKGAKTKSPYAMYGYS